MTPTVSHFSIIKELPWQQARAGNVVGGGDWSEDRLVPDIIRNLERGDPIVIRNPYAVRPWQHVLESISGYVLLAQRLYQNGNEYSEAWNFGPVDEDAQPVQEVVKLLCDCWGGAGVWELQSGDQPHEAAFLKLDISKSRNRLNWVPRWRLNDAIYHVVDWHKKTALGDDPYALCLDQIEHFFSY